MARFQFTKLPYLARLLVMRMMTTNELVAYSLTSRKSKYIVRNYFKKRDYIEATLRAEFINICTNFEEIEWKRERVKLEFYSREIGVMPLPHSPEYVDAAGKDGKYRWRTLDFVEPRMDAHDWIAHFVRIFRSRKFKLIFDRRSDYTLVSIQNLFYGLEIMGIGISYSHRDFALEILRFFKPIRQLMIIGVKFYPDDMQELEGYIHQNLEYFKLEDSFELGINRLLAMDSKIIELWGSKMRSSDLNTFIRRWIAGTTNRNLEALTIMFDMTRTYLRPSPLSDNYQQDILQNIRCSVVGTELSAPINSLLWAEVDRIVEQYEIQGVDKRKATIQFDVKGVEMRFKFVVGK